ncbi:uncharacterized protein BDCG_17559 [Blastomyces dermatitidis ER-3]|uniref:Uncharacterized protein n=1 Tax=Ajellomyces dermatitidis (strain ER-3 / ATCC MYA-2586) TaxID=559297 RepID=A0ABX2VZ74_AJEDR|nr:uncharacterized protein BDCG_17559 [Blastomyces dermatitidis ER-3]OAT02444.1 hypothetical protein BDCG_17559 [Blastomyces dermatitidis ER-3]
MLFLFKYSAVLQIIKAREHYHRLKREKKKMFKSQMCFIIQNIEKTALLSEHVNLLITEMKPETADQKMRDFETQIDLTEREQQELFSEKIVKRDFKMIIISDEKKKKKKKNKK